MMNQQTLIDLGSPPAYANLTPVKEVGQVAAEVPLAAEADQASSSSLVPQVSCQEKVRAPLETPV